jgi:hypothetical protein
MDSGNEGEERAPLRN